MAETLEGVVRDLTFQASGTSRTLETDQIGGLLTSLPYLHLARNGKVFYVAHTVATAVAPLQVVPSTTAALVLNNTGTGLVVPLFAGLYLGSGTAGIGVTLFGQSGIAPLATQLIANGTGVTIGSTRGADTSNCFGDVSKATTGNWCQLGSADVSAAAVPGTGALFPLNGLFVIKPTYAFGLHALAGAGTTSKYCFSVIWAEIPGTTP